MSKHTQGPWISSSYEGDSGSFRVHSIAKSIHGSAGYIAKIPASKFHDEKANAALIAAAPDLLAALEACLARYATGYNKDDNEAVEARAAITKARGEA